MIATCSEHGIEVLEYFLKECKYGINTKNKNGFTLLMYAIIFSKKIKNIKYLVENCKSDLEAVDNWGNTALLLAVKEDIDLDIIKYLV